MAFGQSGVIGHNVLSLAVEAYRYEIEYAPLLSTMADGAKEIALI